MKILLFADLLLDSVPARDLFRRVRDLARTHDVDVICCAGNLINNNSAGADTIAFLNEQLDYLGRATFLITPGPADSLSDDSLYVGLHPRPNVRIFHEAGFRGVQIEDAELGVVSFWGAPHRDTGPPPARADSVSSHGGVNIGLFYYQPPAPRDAFENYAGPALVPPPRPEEMVPGARHALFGGPSAMHTDRYTCAGPASEGVDLIELTGAGIAHQRLSTVDGADSGTDAGAEPPWVAQILATTDHEWSRPVGPLSVFRAFQSDIANLEPGMQPAVRRAGEMAMEATKEQAGVNNVG